LLHGAVGQLAVQAQAGFAAAQGGATAQGQGLHDRHAAFDAVSAGALGRTIDVEHRGAVHVHHVAALHHQVVLPFVGEEELSHVHPLLKGLAIAHATDDGHVVTRWGSATGGGQHVAEAGVGRFERVAARPPHQAQHRHLVAAHLQQGDGDLRIAQETAVAQGVGNLLFSGGDGQAAHFHQPNERVCEGAAFGDAGFEREVGVLEDLDANGIAGGQGVVGIRLAGFGGGGDVGLGLCPGGQGQAGTAQHSGGQQVRAALQRVA